VNLILGRRVMRLGRSLIFGSLTEIWREVRKLKVFLETVIKTTIELKINLISQKIER